MSVVIWGFQEMAEMAHYYLTREGHRVSAFCVDGQYIKEQKLFDLPVIPFEEILVRRPAATSDFFAPVYATNMNQLRAEIASRIRAAGYKLISYVDPKANIQNAKIGSNCFIFNGVEMQPFVTIGDNVFIGPNTVVAHHCKIEDNCFISGNVAIAGKTRVGANSFIGTGADILHDLFICEGTIVAQSASLTKDTEPWSMYMGVPAKKREGIDTRSVTL